MDYNIKITLQKFHCNLKNTHYHRQDLNALAEGLTNSCNGTCWQLISSYNGVSQSCFNVY